MLFLWILIVSMSAVSLETVLGQQLIEFSHTKILVQWHLFSGVGGCKQLLSDGSSQGNFMVQG